jgi:hypothetical protein
MGFGSLQHIRKRRSTHAGMPARYVPSSGFGYPRDGFLPSNPCRFSFTPAALMGFTLRSVSLSKGSRNVSVRKHPQTVPPASDPAAVAESRPNGLRFLGFDPFESPLRPDEGLARRPPDTPMGFALPGLLIASLGQRFGRPPLLRFVVPVASHEPDRRPRVSINWRPAQSGVAPKRAGPTGPPS